MRHCSESEFRNVAENLHDIVARFNLRMRYEYVNRSVEGVIGLSPSEVLGRTNAELGVPADLVYILDVKMRDVFNTAQPQTLEFIYPTNDGPSHFECRLVPEFGSDGGVESILPITQDVNSRIRVQEQSREQRLDLTHVADLGTQEKLISEFVHEINQPLHAISNFVGACLMMLDSTPANQQPILVGWLTQISEQTARAAEIIRRARRFLHKTPMQRSVVNINEIVRECMAFINIELRMHQVELCCELSDVLPQVIADPVQIQQVVLNLVRAAIRAVSENTDNDRKLLISTAAAANDVQISICNNGGSLSPESDRKLVEMFLSVPPENLDLALSQSIVRSHAGRLSAEFNADHCATLYFTLPARKEDIDAAYSDALFGIRH